MEQIFSKMYKNKSSERQIIEEQDEVYAINKIDLVIGRGVVKHIIGCKYPQYGWAEPNALFATNQAKRLINHSIRIAKRKEFIPTVILFLLKSYKKKIEFINDILISYNELALRALSPYIMHPHYLQPVSRNVLAFVTKFLISLGIDQKVANDTGNIMASIIEFDNAYRFRLQDVIGEKNMFDTYLERDHEVVAGKFKPLRPLIKILLKRKWFKKALDEALEHINIEEMKLDEADRFWVAQRPDYNFFGKTLEERMEMIKDEKIPKTMSRNRFERISKRNEHNKRK